MSDLKPKRSAPFCIRLSEAERAQLTRDAGNMPLGAYVKSILFNPRGSTRTDRRIDRDMLAQLLALSGRSRVAENLQALADAARSGSLAVTPDTQAQINEAVNTVQRFYQTLLKLIRPRSRE